MRIIFPCLAGLLLLLCGVSSAAPSAPPPPAIDATASLAAMFGQLPIVSDVVLNPSGTRLAWIDNGRPLQSVEVYDVAGRATLLRSPSPEQIRLRYLLWSDDDTLLLVGSMQYTARGWEGGGKHELFRFVAIDVTTGTSKLLLHDHGMTSYTNGADLVAARTSQPGKVLLATFDYFIAATGRRTGTRLQSGRRQSGWTYNMYEVDTRSGAVRELERGTPHTHLWVVDDQGVLVARSEWQTQRRLFTVLRRDETGWTAIFQRTMDRPPVSLEVTADRQALWLLGAMDDADMALRTLPLAGGELQPQLAGRTVRRVLSDAYTRQPLRVDLLDPDEPSVWLDDTARLRREGLHKIFAGQQVSIVSRSQDSKRMVVQANRRSHPAVFYLVDYTRGTADIVAEAYPQLNDRPLGHVERFSYTARDGYEIPAFLTTPPNVPGLAPLVVLPHGGPASHDTGDFDWMVQFLAARGYAVLQPQFRGSTGHGRAHEQAGRRQWGRLMQDDVTDGVQHLIREGKAQAGRVCIAGASYGGYAALAGAAFTPDLYRCAISINGISNLPAMLRREALDHGKDSDAVAYWYSHVGAPNDRAVIDASPSRAAERITARILLLHGTGDSVVPIEQSRLMYKAMPSRNRATLIELKGEDHWLSRADTRTKVLEEVGRFLDQHLPVTEASAAQ